MNDRRTNVHFELQSRKGSNWTIIKVLDDEKKAVKLGDEAFESGGHDAVRIIREKFDRRSETFSSLEIFYRGKRRKASKYDSDDSIAPCWKPADLYSLNGRRTIDHLLRDSLELWQITPSELVHSPDHYFRLNNAGTVLQGAVQKAAVIQVRETEQPVQERMKQIYLLIEHALERLRRDWKTMEFPAWEDKQGFLDAVRAIENQNEAVYVLAISLTRDLDPIATTGEKLERILSLIDARTGVWVLRVMDEFISELLSTPAVIMSLTGEADDLAGALQTLALLANGRLGEGGSAQARQLSAFLEKQLLPLSKTALLGRIRKELNGKQHLGSGGLKSELEAMSAIGRAARSGEDTFDDLIVTEALDERCKRFMNQYFIDEHMKDEQGGPVARINHLLDLDEHVYGQSNKEKLANFINPILLADENTAFFEASDGKYSERLKTLSGLQGRIMKSGLASAQVKKMAGQIDEMCLSIIEDSRLLEKVESNAEGPHEAGQKLLEMLADGQFTVGKTSSLVREEARRYMKMPNFLEKCIDADDGLASAQKLINLKSLLVKAGMSGGQKESA